MIEFGPVLAAHLAAGKATAIHYLVRIFATNKITGEEEVLRVWSGTETLYFTIGGEVMSFVAVGGHMEPPEIINAVGLELRNHRVKFSELSPEILNATKLYHLHGKRIEVYEVYIDPDTLNILDAPLRRLKGKIDEAPTDRAPVGGAGFIEIRFRGSSADLHRGIGLKKSAAALEDRSENDTFRSHNVISGSVPVAWGEMLRDVTPKPAPATKSNTSGTRTNRPDNSQG